MHHIDMEKVGDCLNMEDIFVELEGRVEKGPDFMLQLENNLSRLLVNEVFESELILLKGHLLSVIAIPEARVPPHNVHSPLTSNWNRSGPSEHSQKVIDIDCQVVPLILTNLCPVSEDQELLVPGNTYHDPHIALSPWENLCTKYLPILLANAGKSARVLDPVFNGAHAQPDGPA